MKASISFTLLAFLWISTSGFAQSLLNSPGFDIGTGVNLNVTTVMCSARQSDGKILIGGRLGNYNGTPIGGLCRLNTDGSLDTNFYAAEWDVSNWDPFITAITIQEDGKILVGGTFTNINGANSSGIARLNTDGTIDTTFHTGSGFSPESGFNTPIVYSIVLQSDDKIIAAGNFAEYDGTVRKSIARLNDDGSLDTSYDPGQSFIYANQGFESSATFYSAVIQPDGKLIMAGTFDSYDTTTLKGFARLNTDGTLDVSFSTAADFGIDPAFNAGNFTYIYKVALQADNKVIVAGFFTEIDGVPHTSIARLLSTGALDNSFNTSAGSFGFPGNGSPLAVPEAITVQADGKILVGGSFDTYDGFSRDNILRFEANGDLDYGFYLDDQNDSNSSVYTIISINDEKLFIGGLFTSIQNESRNRLAMLDVCGNSSSTSVTTCNDYLWADNSTTYTTSGTYFATLQNANGCDSVRVLQLTIPEILDPQEICIVGLDSLTNENRIVWEKPLSQSIDSFYVYKETSTSDVYEQVGAVDYDDLGVFIDNNSNPAIQPYRYKVSILDTCGRETELSTTSHKTIHLTINQGVGDTWNLIWSSYEGITVPSYKIYRGTSLSTMTLLTTVSGGTNSYSDLNAPGDVYYQIEFVNPNDCDPTKIVNYNSSRSNITSNTGLGIASKTANEFSLSPNPAKDEVILHLPTTTGTITIYSLIGTKVFETAVKQQEEILPIQGLASGMYRVVYYTGENVSEQLFMKQ